MFRQKWRSPAVLLLVSFHHDFSREMPFAMAPWRCFGKATGSHAYGCPHETWTFPDTTPVLDSNPRMKPHEGVSK